MNRILVICKKAYALLRKMTNYLHYYSGLYALTNIVLKRKGLIILFYHRLKKRENDMVFPHLAIKIKCFEQHMKYLSKNYRIITMDDVKDMLVSDDNFHSDFVVVTFDDGYRDNHTYGLEIFKEYQVRPTIYLTANGVEEQEYLWFDRVAHIVYSSPLDMVYIDILEREFDLRQFKNRTELIGMITDKFKEYKDMERLKGIDMFSEKLRVKIPQNCNLMMDWSDVRDLLLAGAEIGCHTMNHPILTQISAESLNNEIILSKQLIEERILRKVKHFAYTNGKKDDYNDAIKDLVEKHYDTAVTTIFGVNYSGEDSYELKRIGVGEGVSLIDLKILIQKARIRSFKSRKKG